MELLFVLNDVLNVNKQLIPIKQIILLYEDNFIFFVLYRITTQEFSYNYLYNYFLDYKMYHFPCFNFILSLIFILPTASCASICTHTECFDSPGSFSSPNYPNNYWDYVKMSWLITSPKGQVVTINFDSHFHTRCAGDYVWIYNGSSTSDSEIGKYCGTAGPVGNITSSSNGNLLVIFTSNSRDVSFGFSATFYFEGKQTVVASLIINL